MPELLEIPARYLLLLSRGTALWMVLCGAVGAGALWAWRRSPQLDRRVAWAFVVPALLLGLYALVSQAAVFDDAYISFRYIDNWFRGNGLVFNVGEYVEGYSNPLWVGLVGLMHGVTGLEIPLSALVLNGVVYIGLVAATVGVSFELAGPSARPLPIAAAVVAADRAVAAFATTGMETLLGALLVVLAAWCLARKPTLRMAALAGVLLSLAVVHRLDHAVFWVAGGLAVLSIPTADEGWVGRAKAALAYGVPVVLVLVHLGLKHWYYGDILPNTYYAKSAEDWAVARGMVYFTTYLFGSHGWMALPLLALGVWRSIVPPSGAPRNRAFGVFVLLSAGAWWLYILKVGGDFMYARFCLPAFPLMMLGAEAGMRSIVRPGRQLVAFAVLAAMLGGLRIMPQRRTWGQADENTVYPVIGLFPVEIEHPSWREGQFFKEVFTDRGHEVYMASCCIGMVTYYSRQRMLDIHGLTDRETARKPRKRVGLAGHDKSASPIEVRRRGVEIARWGNRDPLPFRPVTRLRFPGKSKRELRRTYSVVNWTPRLMQIIRKVPEVKRGRIQPAIDSYLEGIDGRPVPEVRQHLFFLDLLYFRHWGDPARRESFEAFLESSEGTPGDSAGQPP